MINVKYCPSRLYLKVEGHAESADYGRDLVCAAASVLFQTLLKTLEAISDDVENRVFPGDSYVRYEPVTEDESDRASMAFATIAIGYDWLSNQWPEYIEFHVTDSD